MRIDNKNAATAAIMALLVAKSSKKKSGVHYIGGRRFTTRVIGSEIIVSEHADSFKRDDLTSKRARLMTGGVATAKEVAKLDKEIAKLKPKTFSAAVADVEAALSDAASAICAKVPNEDA